MTLITFPLNGTDGTAATTANTGATTIYNGSGSTLTLLAAAAYQGSTGLRTVSSGANAACFLFRFSGSATATQAAYSVRFKIPAAAPANASTFMGVFDSTLGAYTVRLQYTPSGTVQILDSGFNTAAVLTAAQATAGSWFRFELVVTNLSTTAGALTVRAYNSSNTQVGSTLSSSAANLGTNPMVGLIIGSAESIANTFDLDSVQMNNGSTTEIGEYVPSATPPTVVAGANQTIPSTGTSVNVTCTATPQGGTTIASYSWTVTGISTTGAVITPPTITNASSQTASFTPATAGRYIASVTATDSNGNTSTAATTRVFVPGLVITPIEVTSNAGWTLTPASNVNDSNDATYTDSGATGTGNVLVYRLAPLKAATAGFSMTIRSLVQAVGGTQRVELLEGATVRKNWGALAPATTMGDQALTLTTAEMATITSWNELDVRLTQV